MKVVSRVIRGIKYVKIDGFIPSSDVETEAIFEQAALFHRFVVYGKKAGVLAVVTDFDNNKVVGTLISVDEITVFVESSWEMDFFRRMDTAYLAKTSKLGIATDGLIEYPFVESASEDGFAREEFNSFFCDMDDVVVPALACDLTYKVYKDKPYTYEYYKVVDYASAQATYKALFECNEKSQVKGNEIDILGDTKCKATDFSPTDKPEKVVDKSVIQENKFEEMKKLGIVNYESSNFTDPEHAIIYKKLCDVENLLKSLSLDKVLKDTIEKTLEGYIVTRNIKTYSGKGEHAPAKKRKISEGKILEMRQNGVSVSDICKEAGVSRQAIYAVLNKHK